MVASEAHPVREDRWPRRSRGRLARCARPAWATASRWCCRVTAASTSPEPARRSPACSWAAAAQRVAFRTTEEHGGVTAVFVDVPELSTATAGCITSTALIIPTTPGALRCSAARRWSTRGCRVSGHPSSTRTTGRPGWCRCTRRCTSRRILLSEACPPIFTIHNLAFQGTFPASTLSVDRPRVGNARYAGARVLEPDQLPEGRHQLQRTSHHGEPDLRARDPDAGVRVWPGRRAAAPRRRVDRHSQRDRRRAMESGDGSIHRRVV